MNFRNFGWMIAAAALVAACGGGGGGGGPVSSTANFPTKTAYTNFVQQAKSTAFTISGTVSGVAVSGNGTLTTGGLASTMFEGQVAFQKATTVTGTVSGNGQTAPLASTSTAYYDTNYLPLGDDDGEYAVVQGAVTIPTTARVGDTGILYTSNRYTSAAKTTFLGTEVVSYVMEADTANTALLKLISTLKNTSGAVTSTDTLTIRMAADGGITFVSEGVLATGVALTFTFQ